MARFSLKWLFVGVAVVGLGLTALIQASDVALAGIHMLHAIGIGVAGTYAVVKRARAPFAVGYVVMALALYYADYKSATDIAEGLFFDRSYADTLRREEQMEYAFDTDAREQIAIVLLAITIEAFGGLFAEWVAYKDRKPEGPAK